MAAGCSEVSLMLCFSFGLCCAVVLFIRIYQTACERYLLFGFLISKPGASIAKGK